MTSDTRKRVGLKEVLGSDDRDPMDRPFIHKDVLLAWFGWSGETLRRYQKDRSFPRSVNGVLSVAAVCQWFDDQTTPPRRRVTKKKVASRA